MDTCPNCGAEVESWENVCGECGTNLRGAEPNDGGSWGQDEPKQGQQPTGGQGGQPRGQQPSQGRGQQPPQGGGRQQPREGQQRGQRQPQGGQPPQGGQRRGQQPRGGPQNARRRRSQSNSSGVGRREVLAGGGVAVAALAGGFFLLSNSGGSSASPGSDFSSAGSISEGEYGEFSIDSGEEHYFEIDLDQGDQLEVTMQFDHDGGDLDIDLYNPDQMVVDSGTSVSDDETVSVTASQSGTYYVVPYGFLSASNDYELDVDVN